MTAKIADYQNFLHNEMAVSSALRTALAAANAMVADMEAKITRREAEMSAWLSENSPYVFADQKHLEANTEARAYWHYGYVIALRDVTQGKKP